MAQPNIRVAIVGGGLGGASMANALLNKPRLDVHVYESAPEFSERGAAVGIPTHAIGALEAIIPSARDVILDKAGAVPSNSSRIVLASGPHAGEKVFDIPSSDQNVIVHRAALLSALVAPLPKAALHVNKKLETVSVQGSKINLAFSDGATETFDAVIGADGIFGSVRKHVLQDGASLHAATPAGFWDCRYLVPFGKAKAALGARYFTEHRQYCWCGGGAFIMHDVLDNGETVQCVVSAVEKDQPEDRSRPLTREILEMALKNCLDGPIARNMIELLLQSPDLRLYSQWEHKSTPAYARGNVCIMGDAAHASTPWQGSGAAMAIEDAAVLGALLGDVEKPEEVTIAFRAYEQVRRLRCQNIIDSSKVTGQIMCCQGQAASADADAMRKLLGERWGFITGFNIVEEMQKAVSRFNQLKE
ncbi:salicylate hydroxylase [Cordyceps fumosorosea ARSEF 2679]|uniref:Salicylate hydroxylase n=1 Tax=Cordyceps fumosorosea (strain ARSEF 2679) TaxID=1081104 RepID=A0A168BYF9_CORFA|nr:salicylate hydroxylase [Cordyceps fumosorosea ARSEF 2679]OAA70708.1 salicylate hydroxylase [Cordyceps fumosorosea ARSEF 2679]